MDTVPVSEVTEDKMVAMMVGREISNYYFKPEPPKTKEIVFEVRNLTRAGMFNNVSFKLYKGEILGVAGLIGAGRTEVMRAAFGADPYDSGECLMDGKPYKAKTPKDTIKKGLGLIPEDRRGQGLLLEKNCKGKHITGIAFCQLQPWVYQLWLGKAGVSVIYRKAED